MVDNHQSNSPGAVVTQFVEVAQSNPKTTGGAVCALVLPSEQAACRALSGGQTGGSSSIEDFAIGKVAIEGGRALVATTGKTCQGYGDCQTNTDPNTGFDGGASFDTLFEEATQSPGAANTWIVPCEEVNGHWYLVLAYL